jgi:hypothetical protein
MMLMKTCISFTRNTQADMLPKLAEKNSAAAVKFGG